MGVVVGVGGEGVGGGDGRGESDPGGQVGGDQEEGAVGVGDVDVAIGFPQQPGDLAGAWARAPLPARSRVVPVRFCPPPSESLPCCHHDPTAVTIDDRTMPTDR